MEAHERELLVARISSGSIRCKVKDAFGKRVTLLIKRPSRDDIYVANEIFMEVLSDTDRELLDEPGLMAFLMANGWGDEQEGLLSNLPKEIEQFKISLFEATFKSNEREIIRKALAVAKAKLGQILMERHRYDHLSCLGSANIAKSRYLLGKSLYMPDGYQVYRDDQFWEEPSMLLDSAMTWYAQSRIDEAKYRELARTEPWRSTWAARKVEGTLFGIAPVDYTDEQRTLATWSTVYDNAFQHPECPADAAIDDDDMFDGWMLIQKAKREQAQQVNSADEVVKNEAIRSSQEVYIPANSAEDARKVGDLNDPYAKAVQKQRFGYLKEKGQVNEIDMPDTRQRLRMEATNRLSQLMAK